MKHLMTSDKAFRAWCKRPGCQTSLQGGIVESMTKKDLDEYFTSSCPGVFNPKKFKMTYRESVNYLLKYAEKEIKAWQKLIDYWKDK